MKTTFTIYGLCLLMMCGSALPSPSGAQERDYERESTDLAETPMPDRVEPVATKRTSAAAAAPINKDGTVKTNSLESTSKQIKELAAKKEALRVEMAIIEAKMAQLTSKHEEEREANFSPEGRGILFSSLPDHLGISSPISPWDFVPFIPGIGPIAPALPLIGRIIGGHFKCPMIKAMWNAISNQVEQVVKEATKLASNMLLDILNLGCQGLLGLAQMADALGKTDFCVSPPCGPFNKTVAIPGTDTNLIATAKANVEVCLGLKRINFHKASCDNLIEIIDKNIEKWINEQRGFTTSIFEGLFDKVGCRSYFGRRLNAEEEKEHSKRSDIEDAILTSIGEIINETVHQNRRTLKELPEGNHSDAMKKLAQELIVSDKMQPRKVARSAYNKLMEDLGKMIAEGYADDYSIPDDRGQRRLNNVCQDDGVCKGFAIAPSELQFGLSIRGGLDFSFEAANKLEETFHVDLMALANNTRNNPIAFQFTVGLFVGIAFHMSISLTIQVPFEATVSFDATASVQGSFTFSNLGGEVLFTESGVRVQNQEARLCARLDPTSASVNVGVSASLTMHATLEIEATLALAGLHFGFAGSASMEAAMGVDTTLCASTGTCPALLSKGTMYAEYPTSETVVVGHNQAQASVGAWAYVTYPALSLMLVYPSQELVEVRLNANGCLQTKVTHDEQPDVK